MLREFTNGLMALLTLSVLLLVGCSDDKAPAQAEQGHKEDKAGRLFDTQRSALEQAKGAADAAGLRNQQFQERAREID